ncbi:hypothetical protein ABK040_005613 [Willaertia magna]
MSTNSHHFHLSIIPFFFFFFFFLFISITFQQEINHIFNWGRNHDRELGILLPDTNIYTPKHLPNIESQLKSIDSTGFYNDTKIQIFQGIKFTYFSSNSFDNSTKKYLDYSILLGCGYNGDKYLGLYTPITVSNPTLPFRYSWGADYDYRTLGTTMYGKTVKEIIGYETLNYEVVTTLPKTMSHPDLPNVIVKLNYTKVAVCGNALNQETFFVTTDSGFLFVWGDANGGKRGDGSGFNSNPVLHPLRNVTDIVCGNLQTNVAVMAITSDNNVYYWGSMIAIVPWPNGQPQVNSPTLLDISVITGDFDKVVKIKHSGRHALLLTEKGMVYGFGGDDARQVSGQTEFSGSPVPPLFNVTQLIAGGMKRIKEIYVGGETSSGVLTEDNLLYTWGTGFGRGRASNGGSSPQLVELPEDDNKVLYASTDGNEDVYLPATLLSSSLFNGEKIISVDSKYRHIAVLTSNGNVYTWGDSTNYKLGNKNNQGAIGTPIKVDLSLPAKAIALYCHTFGKLYSAGDNAGGIANGLAQPATINTFTMVSGISGVTKIITGADGSALIITVDGKAYKLNNPISKIYPNDGSDQFIINGAITYYNVFLITSKKRLYGGGSNNAYQMTTHPLDSDYPLAPAQLYPMTVDFGGEMPHLISITSGFSGATSIQLVTVKEYQCFVPVSISGEM